MPTYDYECDACGHAFELFQPITAKPIRTCPKCKKRKARRLIGAGAGIIFKGSGFYQTDYRSDAYKQAAQKAKSEGAPAAEKSAGGEASKSGGEKPKASADKPKSGSSGKKKDA